MKKIILSFGIMLFAGMNVFGQELALNQPVTKEVKELNSSFISWENFVHDFGTIEKGIPVSVKFEFINAGSSSISIRSVSSSCGCTVTDYTKTELAPGESGYVKATYNAAKEGAFHKKVVVTTSREGEQKILTVQGVVK